MSLEDYENVNLSHPALFKSLKRQKWEKRMFCEYSKALKKAVDEGGCFGRADFCVDLMLILLKLFIRISFVITILTCSTFTVCSLFTSQFALSTKFAQWNFISTCCTEIFDNISFHLKLLAHDQF